MALIKCSECKNKISKKAKLCPNCGAPAKKKTSLFTWMIAGLFGLAMYGASSSYSYDSAPIDQIKQTQLSKKDKQEIQIKAERLAYESRKRDTIYQAKKAVSKLMKDPDSTKFKNVFFNETKKGGAVACGNFMSKNSFGAYTGFQRFISNGVTTFFEDKDINIADTWVKVCLNEKVS